MRAPVQQLPVSLKPAPIPAVGPASFANISSPKTPRQILSRLAAPVFATSLSPTPLTLYRPAPCSLMMWRAEHRSSIRTTVLGFAGCTRGR